MRRFSIERVTAAAVMLAVGLFALWFVAGGITAWLRPEPPGAGTKAPAFSLTTTRGDTSDLSDYRGHVVLLEFWISNCVGCIGATPRLNRLHDRFETDGLAVVSVHAGTDDKTRLDRVIKTRAIQYPVLLDEGEVALAYGVTAFPHTVLIDRQGVIREVHDNLVSETRLRRQVEALLNES